MNLEDLTPEQMEKAKACETSEDLLKLAKEEGMALSDEELDSLSGGWGDTNISCSHGCFGYDCFLYSCKQVDCGTVTCSIYN